MIAKWVREVLNVARKREGWAVPMIKMGRGVCNSVWAVPMIKMGRGGYNSVWAIPMIKMGRRRYNSIWGVPMIKIRRGGYNSVWGVPAYLSGVPGFTHGFLKGSVLLNFLVFLCFFFKYYPKRQELLTLHKHLSSLRVFLWGLYYSFFFWVVFIVLFVFVSCLESNVARFWFVHSWLPLRLSLTCIEYIISFFFFYTYWLPIMEHLIWHVYIESRNE
jgi:hypothetical protein